MPPHRSQRCNRFNCGLSLELLDRNYEAVIRIQSYLGDFTTGARDGETSETVEVHMAKRSIRHIANCHVDVVEIVTKLKEMGVRRASLCEVDELVRWIAAGKELTREDILRCLNPDGFEPMPSSPSSRYPIAEGRND